MKEIVYFVFLVGPTHYISSSGFSSLLGGLLASCSYSREPNIREITSNQAHDSKTHAQNHKT